MARQMLGSLQHVLRSKHSLSASNSGLLHGPTGLGWRRQRCFLQKLEIQNMMSPKHQIKAYSLQGVSWNLQGDEHWCRSMTDVDTDSRVTDWLACRLLTTLERTRPVFQHAFSSNTRCSASSSRQVCQPLLLENVSLSQLASSILVFAFIVEWQTTRLLLWEFLYSTECMCQVFYIWRNRNHTPGFNSMGTLIHCSWLCVRSHNTSSNCVEALSKKIKLQSNQSVPWTILMMDMKPNLIWNSAQRRPWEMGLSYLAPSLKILVSKAICQ